MPLDPVLASVLDLMAAGGSPSLASGSPEQARAGFRAMTVGLRAPGSLAEVGSVEDDTVEAPGGPVRVRTYRPATEGPHPTVVFFHGGGFVIGDLETHDDHARLLCRDVDAVVVSVEYRLAPETPFPGGYDDCLAAYRWVVEHAADLGGDVTRLAVAGDSAVGNLAAAVALAARDAGSPLRAQLLLYPSVDLVEGDGHASRAENATGYLLTAEDMRWFGDHYLSDVAHAEDPRASVLKAPDLSGVAPAVVATAEYDPLRDEGEAYADRLEANGVTVERARYDGMIHGYVDMAPFSPAAEAAVADTISRFRRLLQR